MRPNVDSDHSGQQFVNIGNRFVNLNDLNVDLIASVNPFQGAYEVISKNIDAPLLKTLKTSLASQRVNMTEEEAVMLWPRINQFKEDHGRAPSIDSMDNIEKRLAEGLAYIQKRYAEKKQQKDNE